MKREKLVAKIKTLGKKTFTTTELRRLFPGEKYLTTSARRLISAGFIRSVSRGIYALATETIEPEKLAQQLYYPSYTSFETALARYGIINQGSNVLTLATTRHGKKTTLDQTAVEFRQLRPELFFGFNLLDGIYVAEPEKALLDTLYMVAIGKKKLSLANWYLDSVDKSKVKKYLIAFPPPVHKLYQKLTAIHPQDT